MRYLIRRNPTDSLLPWHRAMDRFFDDDFFRSFGYIPTRDENRWHELALDLSEDENSLKVEASLPGINPEEVEISIHDGVLTIRGEVESEDEKEEEGKYYLRERHYGSFHRAIRLPVDVNADSAEAVFENGVLHLTLPKAEETKPRRITVKAS